MHPLRLLFLFFFLTSLTKGLAQIVPLSEKATVSLLTCGTGNEMYSLFGHTAIRITDPENNIDRVYNYGAFDFNTPNFVVKFSKGDLQYFVTSGTFREFLYEYNYDKRSVYEQQLAFSDIQKQYLFDTLNATLLSDERFYTYKFIDRNCTTMVVDLLNKIMGKEVIVKTKNKEATYRDVLYPYFDGHFYEQLGTSIIFGKKVDQKAVKLFLPFELWDSVNAVQYNNAPLLKEQKTWLEFKAVPAPFSWWNNLYSLLILLIILNLLNNKFVTLYYFALIGALGIFFTFAGFYSYHPELAWNYNALLFNPLLLLLGYFYLRKNTKGVYTTAVLVLFSTLVYTVLVVTKVYFWIVLPLIMTQVILLLRMVRQNDIVRSE